MPVAPYPHLHLAIPEEMEVGEVRSSARANVSLIASILSDLRHNSQAAVLENLSTEGAKIQSSAFLGNIGDVFRISTQLRVLGKETVIQLQASIRSRQQTDDDYSYGVEFFEVSDQQRLLIYAFVLANLTGHP